VTRLFQTNSPTAQTDTHTIGTPMSGLSPDNSAKTMMTNMYKMVESIGTVVTKLAVQNSETNEIMKQTNNTMKEMMVQQAATMNNLMAIMCRNEERRYEGETSRVPQNINPTSTPADSTMTNSQQSMTQNQSPQKRHRTDRQEDGDGTATTATTTTTTTPTQHEQAEVLQDVRMEDGQHERESQIDQNRTVGEDEEEDHNKTMYGKETNTDQTHIPLTDTNETRMSKGQVTTPIAEGNFEHQFETTKKDKAKIYPFPGGNNGGSQQ
jgi:acetyl/propionyl-CoA carboxylase alpha subunit